MITSSLKKCVISILLVLPLLVSGTDEGTAVANDTKEGQIYLSKSQLPDFLEVYAGMFSDVQFYDVSATSVSSDLSIVVQAPFKISLHCYEDFKQSINLSKDGSTINNTRIFVRFFPQETGDMTGHISHTATGADTKQLTLQGEGMLPAIPQGYYSTATSNGSRLKSQLFDIINNHRTQTYSSLWTHFTSTDATFSGKVWDIYSDTPCDDPPYIYTFGEDQDTGSGGNQEGDVYNREHSMPRSWFGGAVDPMNTDLFHIYPVDKWVNARRANEPYGEVNNANWTSLNGGKLGNNSLSGYSGTAFEPIDEYKGDLARTFLYMITRYENQIQFWDFSPEGNHILSQETYPGYSSWAMEMLLRWHREDPVSQKEIRRNNAVYNIQGNRNPFIDNPEFVERIWGDTTLSNRQLPREEVFRLYPNPARNSVTVEAAVNIISVELLCLNGSILASWFPAQAHKTITLHSIPAGLYIIMLKTENGLSRKKLHVM
jgi:endonuclease I